MGVTASRGIRLNIKPEAGQRFELLTVSEGGNE